MHWHFPPLKRFNSEGSPAFHGSGKRPWKRVRLESGRGFPGNDKRCAAGGSMRVNVMGYVIQLFLVLKGILSAKGRVS